MIVQDPRLPLNHFSWSQRAGYNFFQVLDHFIGRPMVIKLLGGIRYKAFLNIAKTFEAKGEGKIIDVEYRTDLGEKEFKDYYVKKGIPVVFKGAAKHWNCVKQWDLNWLKESHGSDEVPIIHVNDPDKGIEYTTLRDLIERLQNGDKNSYFRYYNLVHRHPEHRADFDLAWLQSHSHKRKYFEAFQAFIGGADTRTELHNAHISNLFVQVSGVKEWILYPNYFVPFLDPPSTMNGIYRNTPVRAGGKPFSPFEPDYKGYPYYRYLDGYRVVLEPGDVFYNPPFMWHTVYNRTDTIGIGFRWVNFANAFRNSPVYYSLDLLSYRPNYLKAIRMTEKDANEQFIQRLQMMQKQRKKVKEDFT